MFLILILMFFVGILQVVWTPIHAAFTKHPEVRRHFGYYSLGVVAYFLILWFTTGLLGLEEGNPLVILHFFGGSWALCTYHCWIVSKSMAPHPNPDFDAMR